MIVVEVVQAWPRRHETWRLELDDGATVADALAVCGVDAPVAVFGERASADRPLEDGDRIEVLRPLVADPKDARRRRAREGLRDTFVLVGVVAGSLLGLTVLLALTGRSRTG